MSYAIVSTASLKAQWSRLVVRSSHVGAGVSEELQREEPRRSTASGGQTESQCGERRLLWGPSDVPHIILQVRFIAICLSNNDSPGPVASRSFLLSTEYVPRLRWLASSSSCLALWLISNFWLVVFYVIHDKILAWACLARC